MNLSLGNMNESIELLNATTYFDLNTFYDYLNTTLPAKIVYVLLTIITYIVGSTLVLGIIIFERKAGDPQKRNVINRLFSMALINQILFFSLVGGCRFWRIAFGLIDPDVMIWIEGFGYIFCSNFFLFMNQMTIFRYLHIVVWKRVKGLDDEFWAFFLSAGTAGLSCWQYVCEHTPPQVQMHVFKINMEILPGSIGQNR
jgi:hypothetical protein